MQHPFTAMLLYRGISLMAKQMLFNKFRTERRNQRCPENYCLSQKNLPSSNS